MLAIIKKNEGSNILVLAMSADTIEWLLFRYWEFIPFEGLLCFDDGTLIEM